MSWRDRPYSGSSGGGGWGLGGPGFSGNVLAWAPTIGSAFGIRIQVHILFLIYIAVELIRAAGTGLFVWHLRYMAMLFGLVLLHEFGHCFGTRRVGGTADSVLMWPLGGLAYVAPPHRPGAHLISAASGPMVNVVLAILSALVLLAGTGSIQAVPFNPFHLSVPLSVLVLFAEHNWLLWVYQFFILNYIMALFNLCMPIFPLDGGRILQSLLWYRVGYRRSSQLATTIGMVGAVVLGCYGLYVQSYLLIGVAVFGYITCMQQRQALAAESEYGFMDDLPPTQAEGSGKPRKRSWLEGRWARKQQKLAAEQAEVDRILAKVHDSGLASLTRKEKKTLEQATRRQQEEDRRRL